VNAVVHYHLNRPNNYRNAYSQAVSFQQNWGFEKNQKELPTVLKAKNRYFTLGS